MSIDTYLSCDDVRERLTEYLDEALPPGTRKRYEQHLARCAGCTLDLQEFRTTLNRLGTLPHEDMPGRMKERLVGAFQRKIG